MKLAHSMNSVKTLVSIIATKKERREERITEIGEKASTNIKFIKGKVDVEKQDITVSIKQKQYNKRQAKEEIIYKAEPRYADLLMTQDSPKFNANTTLDISHGEMGDFNTKRSNMSPMHFPRINMNTIRPSNGYSPDTNSAERLSPLNRSPDNKPSLRTINRTFSPIKVRYDEFAAVMITDDTPKNTIQKGMLFVDHPMREINNTIFKRYYEETNSKRITSTKPKVVSKGSEQTINQTLATKVKIYEKLQSLQSKQTDNKAYLTFLRQFNKQRPDKYRYIAYKDVSKQNQSAIRNPDEIKSEYAQRTPNKIDKSELVHLSPYSRTAMQTKARYSLAGQDPRRSQSFDTGNIHPIPSGMDGTTYSYLNSQNLPPSNMTPMTFPKFSRGSMMTDSMYEKNISNAGKDQIEKASTFGLRTESNSRRYTSVGRDLKTAGSRLNSNDLIPFKSKTSDYSIKVVKKKRKKFMLEGQAFGQFIKKYEDDKPEELLPKDKATTEKSTLVPS